MRGALAIATAAALLAASAGVAYGDPSAPSTATEPLHLQSESHIVTKGGSELELPPGYFISEPDFDKLDTEFRRLQDQETRLEAENKSLKDSTSGWQPGWLTLAGAVVTGLALGWYAHDKL